MRPGGPAWPDVHRVLMTADPIGGVWTYSIDLAREFGRRGIEVVLATMGRPLTRGQRRQAADIPSLRLHEREYRLEWMPDAWNDVDAAGRWLLDLEHATAPDVVHLGGFAHGALPWRAPCVVVAHSCVLSWWEAVRGGRAPASFDRYRQRVRQGLVGADLVVAPTEAMRQTLERLHGRLPRTAVVWNGRAPAGFGPAAKTPVVFGAGRLWDEAKNLAALDRAAAALPWPVDIAGERLGLDGTVVALRHATWRGVLGPAAMRDALARAAICALPARYEPFGLLAVEAALSGCALVLGDLPSQREIWRDAAIFVAPEDPQALGRALRRLIHDPTGRAALAARARVRARALTPAATADAYLGHYRAIRAKKVA